MTDLDDRAPLERLRPALIGLAVWGVLVGTSAWILRVLIHRKKTDLVHAGRVADLDALTPVAAEPFVWGVVGLTSLLLIRRLPGLTRSGPLSTISLLAIACLGAPFMSTHGHFLLIAVSAAFLALHGMLLPAAASLDGGRRVDPTDRLYALGLFVLVAGLGAAVSMYRHYWFGSGSWDMGCVVHNFHLVSRGLTPVSTVLGDVDFLADHFSVGLYLYAPFIWLDGSGYTVGLIQALNVAVSAPAVFMIARRRGAGRGAALVLGGITGLSFGMQAAYYFDAHHITLGFGFFAAALWAIEDKRLVTASILLFVFSLFKESIGPYVVGLGLLLLARGVRAADRRSIAYGFAWVVGGAVWFVVVSRVLMPLFATRGLPPESHETFADFGPTVFEAAIGMVSHPLKTAGAFFTPFEKVSSMLVTGGGVGFLCLLAPEIAIAALPLFAERFLSSKAQMWEMGYHYSAPLCLYAGWAAALAWPRVQSWLGGRLESLCEGGRSKAPLILSAYVLASTVLIQGVGYYRHSANFLAPRQSYFSTPEQRETNQAAVRFVREHASTDEKIAAQNRILPHLADRQFIYRLGDYRKADWVVLNVSETSWPQDDAFPQRLVRRLVRAKWTLVFSSGASAVLIRPRKEGAPAALPTVEPASELGLSRVKPPVPGKR